MGAAQPSCSGGATQIDENPNTNPRFGMRSPPGAIVPNRSRGVTLPTNTVPSQRNGNTTQMYPIFQTYPLMQAGPPQPELSYPPIQPSNRNLTSHEDTMSVSSFESSITVTNASIPNRKEWATTMPRLVYPRGRSSDAPATTTPRGASNFPPHTSTVGGNTLLTPGANTFTSQTPGSYTPGQYPEGVPEPTLQTPRDPSQNLTQSHLLSAIPEGVEGQDDAKMDELGKQMLELSNQFRARHNLPPIKWSQDLAAIGQQHSENMGLGKAPLSSEGFDDRIKRYSQPLKRFGENILSFHAPLETTAGNQRITYQGSTLSYPSYDVAQKAVNAWINAPTQRKNLLTPEFDLCGVGVYRNSEGVFFATQIFGETTNTVTLMASRGFVNGSAPVSMDELGKEMLKLSNEFRAANGLPPMKWMQELAEIGRGHSKDMGDGRLGFTHRGFRSRIRQYPYWWWRAGENIHMSWLFYDRWTSQVEDGRKTKRVNSRTPVPYDVARLAVNGWIKSPSHRKNLLTPRYNYCGIGVYKNPEGVFYATQMMAYM